MLAAEVSDSYVLRIVSICVGVRSDKSVGRVISEAVTASVVVCRGHIAVSIVGDRHSVMVCQMVILVVAEAVGITVVCGGDNVACRIVGEGFVGGFACIVVHLGALCHPRPLIVSIAHLDVFVKMFFCRYTSQDVVSVFKSRDKHASCVFLHSGDNTTCVIVFGSCYASVGLDYACYSVVCIIGIYSLAVFPVCYAYEVVVYIVFIAYLCSVRVGNSRKITYGVVSVAYNVAKCVLILYNAVKGINLAPLTILQIVLLASTKARSTHKIISLVTH